jgi:hypothetical protein
MAWDEKNGKFKAVNVELYELLHCSVVPKYNILQLCVVFIVLQTDVVGPMKDTRDKKYQEPCKVSFYSNSN